MPHYPPPAHYSVFPNLCINNQRKAWSVFLPLIQFALHQVLGYGFVSVARAWRARVRCYKVLEQEMADGSDENSLPPYGYGYRHPYYGHLYTGSSAGVAYSTWPQSLTAWSTGDQSPPFFDTVDLTATASVNDEESPTAATAGDCRTSSRKKDPTYSYLVKIIPPNNKSNCT